MSAKRLGWAVVVLLMTLAAPATAQRNELSAIVGRTFISDQGVKNVPAFDTNLRFGNGLSFEANLARRLKGGEGIAALTVEVPVVYNRDEDIHYSVNVVPRQYSAIFITPSLRANLLPEAPFSPWLSLGGGYGHFSQDSQLEFSGNNPGKTGTSTGVFQFGGGLDVRVRPWLGVRAEVRDFYSGIPHLNVDTGRTRQHNYLVGGGIVWHF
jgi:hypothetical protein